MSTLKRLKDKRDSYYQELEDLYLYEPSPFWLSLREHELQSEIAFIEEAISEIETNKINTTKTLIAAIVLVIVLTVVLFIF